MKIAIIGAGKMGRWFTKFFLDEGESVIVSNNSEEELVKIRDEFGVEIANCNADAVKEAERVLICVPIDNFQDVIQEIHGYIRPEKVVMDICSVKQTPVEIMHKFIKSGIVLGTHPMFGPGAKTMKNRNFILTPVTRKERIFAENFKSWLQERGANVFTMSPKRHDQLMQAVLGLPHFIGLVVCDTILEQGNYVEARKIAGSSYSLLLTLAEAIVSEDSSLFTNLQTNIPNVDKIERLFIAKSKEWLSMVKQKDRTALAYKMNLVKDRLNRVSPDYDKSYEAMQRLLQTILKHDEV